MDATARAGELMVLAGAMGEVSVGAVKSLRAQAEQLGAHSVQLLTKYELAQLIHTKLDSAAEPLAESLVKTHLLATDLFDEVPVPMGLACPCSKSLITGVPVVASDGFTYDWNSIKNLRVQESPVTRAPLLAACYFSLGVFQAVDAFLLEHYGIRQPPVPQQKVYVFQNASDQLTISQAPPPDGSFLDALLRMAAEEGSSDLDLDSDGLLDDDGFDNDGYDQEDFAMLYRSVSRTLLNVPGRWSPTHSAALYALMRQFPEIQGDRIAPTTLMDAMTQSAWPPSVSRVRAISLDSGPVFAEVTVARLHNIIDKCKMRFVEQTRVPDLMRMSQNDLPPASERLLRAAAPSLDGVSWSALLTAIDEEDRVALRRMLTELRRHFTETNNTTAVRSIANQLLRVLAVHDDIFFPAAVSVLVDFGANNFQDALLLACLSKNSEVVRRLLSFQISPHTSGPSQPTQHFFWLLTVFAVMRDSLPLCFMIWEHHHNDYEYFSFTVAAAAMLGKPNVLRGFLLAWTLTDHPQAFLWPCKALAQDSSKADSVRMLSSFETAVQSLVLD